MTDQQHSHHTVLQLSSSFPDTHDVEDSCMSSTVIYTHCSSSSIVPYCQAAAIHVPAMHVSVSFLLMLWGKGLVTGVAYCFVHDDMKQFWKAALACATHRKLCQRLFLTEFAPGIPCSPCVWVYKKAQCRGQVQDWCMMLQLHISAVCRAKYVMSPARE